MKPNELKEYGAVRHNPDGSYSLVALDNSFIVDDVDVRKLIFTGSYVNLELNGFKKKETRHIHINNKLHTKQK